MRKSVRILFGPCMIGLLLSLAWGPLFVADWVRTTRPDLDASYKPQTFGIAWMVMVAIPCMWLALLLGAVHIVRVIVRSVRGDREGKQ